MSATVTTIVNNVYGPVAGLSQEHNATQKVRVKAGDLEWRLESVRRFLDDQGLDQLAAVLVHDGDNEDIRSRVGKLVEAVESGSVTLAAGVTTDPRGR